MEKQEDTPATLPTLPTDPEIPDQRYPIFSFLFPTDVVQKKELFFIQEFWKTLSKSPQFKLLKEFTEQEDLSDDLRSALKMIVEIPMAEQYESFLSKNYTKLHEVFRRRTGNLADTYGVMFRGAFPTLEQAKAYTEKLSESEKLFHKYVGLQGNWLPLDSSAADFIGDQKYGNENLNNLMSDFAEQQRKKDEHYKEETQRRLALVREEGARGRLEAGESVPGQAVSLDNDNNRPAVEISRTLDTSIANNDSETTNI